MNPFSFHTTRSIICEIGATRRLGEICRKAGISKPLIVTDAGISRLGLLARIETMLLEASLIVCSFADVVADPPETTIMAALAQAKSVDADGIIGFGGVSSLDTAKLVALMAGSGESLDSIYGIDQAKGKRLPLILIPTTAGTGSEVTAIAMVTRDKHTKTGVIAPQLYPDFAVLDAELTLGLPPRITAETGVDAMVHAIEAYTSLHHKNPYSDMLAREALRLLSRNIETATHHGGQVQARQAMMLGACLAGQAFANAPVAAVHALAYPLGGRFHLSHGLTNALVLAPVLRFNAPIAMTAYAELADIVVPIKNHRRTRYEACNQLIAYFEGLLPLLGLPRRLSEVGVTAADLEMLASEAMKQQRLLVNNPRPVRYDDALAIYMAAFWRPHS